MSGPATQRSARPYPGLRPFEADEWSIFIGRERMIEDVLDRLAEQRLVVIHGSSGAGKSSLVRAGVLPRLSRLHRRRGATLLTAIMRPSGGPLWNMARALADIEGRASDLERVAEIRRRFDSDGARLAAIVTTLEIGASPVCLLLDQFEELFAYAKGAGREEAQLLVELLNGSTVRQEGEADLRVVVTMRSEFLGNCAQFDGLAETVNDSQYLLPRIDRDDLRRAIRRPAEIHGGTVTPDLVEKLIADVSGDPDELPLIQHGLMILWDRAVAVTGAPVLDRALYDKQDGGLAGMVSDHADSMLRQAISAGTEPGVAEAAFRALTDIDSEGRAIRRPITFRALCLIAGGEHRKKELRCILDLFRADGACFVTPAGNAPMADDTMIDIGHEAFIRCWNQISDQTEGWLVREFRDGLIWRSLLVQAGDFEADPASTLSETTTEERSTWMAGRTAAWATRYGGGWPRVEALIAASQRAREVSIRTRKLAREAETNAFQLQSLLLAKLAREPLSRGEPVTAMQLALEGLPTAATDRPVVAQCAGVLAESLAEQREIGILKHGGVVRSVAVSPDDRYVLTASDDASVCLWDRTTCTLVHVLGGDSGASRSAIFSTDGSYILSAADNGSAFLWNTASGKLAATMRGHHRAVLAVALSADSMYAMTASGDRTARLWHATTGVLLAVLDGHQRSVTSCAFSADGRVAMTASNDGSARLWEVPSGRQIQSLRGHSGSILHAAFSQDGRHVLTASEDRTAILWALPSGEPSVTLRGHRGSVNHVQLSSDRSKAVTASDDGTARLWDIRSARELATLRGHRGVVNHATFLADNERVLTVSADATIRLWSAKDGTSLDALSGHDGAVLQTALTGDGEHVVSASWDGTARIWQLAARPPTSLPVSIAGTVASASPDCTMAAVTTFGNDAYIYGFTDGRVRHLDGHPKRVTLAEFSPSSRRLVTASRDNTARIWEVASGGMLAAMSGHEAEIFAATFSPDGRHVLTGSMDNTARLWLAATGEQVASFEGHGSVISDVAFSVDGREARTVSWDRTLRRWDISSGREIAVLSIGQETPHAVSFVAGADRVMVTSQEGIGQLRDATSGAVLVTLRGHESWIQDVSYSPDGSLILTASQDRTARLWDARSGEQLAVLQGHLQPVLQARFSDDAERIVTRSGDSTARVWDRRGNAQFVFELPGHSLCLAMFVPGRAAVRLLYASASSITARNIWIGTSMSELIETARRRLPRELTDDERRHYYLAPGQRGLFQG